MAQKERKQVINLHSPQDKLPVGMLSPGEIGVVHPNTTDAKLFVETVEDSQSASTLATFITEKAVNTKVSTVLDIVDALADTIITKTSGDTIISTSLTDNGSGQTLSVTHKGVSGLTNGFNKISVDAYGHVTATTAVEIGDVSGLTGFYDAVDTVMKPKEFAIASSLNDLNNRINTVSSYTETLADKIEEISGRTVDLSDYYTKEEIEGKHYVNSGDVKTQVENYHYVNSGDVKTQIENYHYVNSGDVKTQVENYHYVNSGDVKTQVEAYHYITSADTLTFFDGAEYVSSAKTITFKHGDDIKATIDATDFIKDGMVDTVAIDTPSGGTYSGETCIIITFNTDAGKENIELPLTDIFDPNNYYTKWEISDKELVVSTAINELNTKIIELSGRTVDLSDYYTKEEIDDMGFVTSDDVETLVESYHYVNSGDVKTQVEAYHYLTGYTETDPIFKASPACGITTTDIANWNSKQDEIDDLDEIRNNAASGASAYTMVIALSGIVSDNYYTKQQISNKEKVVSASLNDLNNKIDVLSGRTVDLSGYYTKTETNNRFYTKTEIDNKPFITGINVNGSAVTVTNKVAEITVSSPTIIDTVEAYSAQTTTGTVVDTTIIKTLLVEKTEYDDDMYVMSQAINDLNDRIVALEALIGTSGSTTTYNAGTY